MSLDKSQYRVPSGVRIRPSQIGHYNFWYPHEKQEFVSTDSFVCEELLWRGSDEWQAVLVSKEQASTYQSPIRVLWVEKALFKDMVLAPAKREMLKKRADENER